MKILVTGGTGFIGRHLIERLKKRNLEIGLIIHKTDTDDRDVKKYSASILDRELLCKAFSDFQPEIVFHLAAQPIVRNSFIYRKLDYETIMTNMMGTQNVFDVSMNTKSIRKVIHISTDKVFGDIDTIQQGSCLLGTKHPYNASKLAGDVLAQMFASYYSVPTTIVRHGNIYGEGDLHWDRIVPRTIKRIHENLSPVIRGDGKTNRDYIYVEDIVDAYVKLMDCRFVDNPHITHFGSEQSYSTEYIIDEILKLMGRIDLAPQYEPMWVGEIPHQHIENVQKINWKQTTPLESGLERTVNWYKDYLEKK